MEIIRVNDGWMPIKRDAQGWIIGRYGRECFSYRDKLYDKGTVVKFDHGPLYGKQKATFLGGDMFLLECGKQVTLRYNTNYGKRKDFEIVEPKYYKIEIPPASNSKIDGLFSTGSGSWDAYNEVKLGFMWYVLAMLVGAIFIDKLLIWIGATTVYFTWKKHK